MLKPASTAELYQHFLACGQQLCTDTRKAVKGTMFFALRGPNFNANAFAAKALESGCAIAVVDDEAFAGQPGTVLVNNGLQALQDLARHHRRQQDIPVLAITGSNAKTTTKELTAAVLAKRFKVLATSGNLNNHIGVPLTLLELRSHHEMAIIEMGANHQGEIAALCAIAEPTFGLITNIGRAHLEGFGGPEGVKKGKGELYRFIEQTGGIVFVNGDDSVLTGLAAGISKVTYGEKKLYDVIGRDCTTSETVSLQFTTRYGEKSWDKLPVVHTRMTGRYNFINCLAAAAVGVHFGIDHGAIGAALRDYRPEMNRSQLLDTGRNTLILDAYNANPDSMKAAIENFSRYSAEKKMLLLGDMFELGEHSREEHNAVVELVKKSNLSEAYFVGREFAAGDHNGFTCFENIEECRRFLERLAPQGYTVLVKGSRSMKMETLKDLL